LKDLARLNLGRVRKKFKYIPYYFFSIHMPRTINGKNLRHSIRIPAPMIEEINRIVKENPGLHYNRQQFIECSIREKIEKTQQLRPRTPNQMNF
jgi:hypothetical protein